MGSGAGLLGEGRGGLLVVALDGLLVVALDGLLVTWGLVVGHAVLREVLAEWLMAVTMRGGELWRWEFDGCWMCLSGFEGVSMPQEYDECWLLLGAMREQASPRNGRGGEVDVVERVCRWFVDLLAREDAPT